MPAQPWDARRRSALLQGLKLFTGLPPTVVEDLAKRFRPRTVPRAGFVFLEGDRAGALHVAAEGRVKILKETAAGRPVILRVIQPGEPFGLSGLWGGATYLASAQALDRAVVLRLPAGDVAELLRTRPDLALALIGELGARLREAEARILDLQTEGAEARIARALLRLARSTAPLPGAEGGRVVPLTRQDLADLTGSTLSTASRTLSAWHRKGIVAALRERVVIADSAALEAIAGTASLR